MSSRHLFKINFNTCGVGVQALIALNILKSTTNYFPGLSTTGRSLSHLPTERLKFRGHEIWDRGVFLDGHLSASRPRPR